MTTQGEFIEATTQSTDFSGALVPKVIDQAILDYSRKYDPMDGLLAETTWPTKTYFFDLADAFPTPQSTTEVQTNTQVVASVSNYAQKSFTIRHFQSRGDLGKIAIQTALVGGGAGSLFMRELQRHAKAMRWYQSWQNLYGDSVASTGTLRPQWDGFATQIDPTNKLIPNGGLNSTIQLADLDNLIDAVEGKVAEPLPGLEYCIMTTTEMFSEFGRLNLSGERFDVPVTMSRRTDNGVVGGDIVEVPGGVQMPSYRGIPILKNSFLSPRGAMSAVTATASGADGAVTTAARFYSVEAVAQQGVTKAAAATTTPGSASNHVALTFTPPVITDALGKASPILLYRVYEGASAATTTLIGVVPAVDTADNAVNTIVDFGNTITAYNGTAGNTFQVTGRYTAASNILGDGLTVPLLAANSQHVYLISRYPDFTRQVILNDFSTQVLANVNPSSIQFAVTADKCLAMRAPLFGALLQTPLTK